jgi:hypothetical protein
MEAVQLNENDDPINICYDNVFKAVFTKDGPESRGAAFSANSTRLAESPRMDCRAPYGRSQ